MSKVEVKSPQYIPANIGEGLSNIEQIAAILYSIVDDLNALKDAIESHTHAENADVSYTQDAETAATDTTVTLNTKKSS